MVIFIDDILIYSKIEGDRVNYLSILFQVLKDAQIYVKYSKCELWLRSVSFLSHIVTSEGVRVDPRKLEAVKSCPRTLSLTDIQSFLGLAGYYRSFVEGFLSIASPLTTLTQKNAKFVLFDKCEKYFQR